MTLGVFFEIALIGIALAVSISLMRKRLASSLIAIAWLAARLLASFCLVTLVCSHVVANSKNFLLLIPLAIVASEIGLTLISRGLRKNAKIVQWQKQAETKLRLPILIEGSVKLFLVAGFWAFICGATVIVVDLLSISSAAQGAMRNTFLVRFLLDNELEQELTQRQADSDSSQMDLIAKHSQEQSDFFKRFAAGVRRNKQDFYSVTGLNEAKQQIELAKRAIQLSADDKVWLLTNDPGLMQLIEHRLIQQVVNDEELIASIERFADGDSKELLVIAANPAINQLIRDGEIKQIIQQIDLEDLLTRCQQRHATPGHE